MEDLHFQTFIHVPNVFGRIVGDDELGDYQYSQYARVFDYHNQEWCYRSVADRQIFLLSMEHYFNQKLRRDGVVYINDVYEALGFDRVEEYERQVGWLYSLDYEGDNFISFYPIHPLTFGRKWITKMDSFVLDFNAIGNLKRYL